MSLLSSSLSELLGSWRDDEPLDTWLPLPEDDELERLAACLLEEEGEATPLGLRYDPPTSQTPSGAASASNVCFHQAVSRPSSPFADVSSKVDSSGIFPAPLCALLKTKSAGPPTRAKRPRVVTTECAEMKQCVEELEASRCRSEDEEDSEDSNETDHDAVQDQKRRAAPEIDWRSISDPAERRRQRRLAKNRLTAAKSRERKKAAWSQLEGRLNDMEQDNKRLRAMIEVLSRENSVLRGQLPGKDQEGKNMGNNTQGERRAGQESAALCITIAIMLCLCLSLPGLDPMSSLQSSLEPLAAPLMLALLAQLLHSSRASRHSKAPCSKLLKALFGVKSLLMCGFTGLTKAVKNEFDFFEHHHPHVSKIEQGLGESRIGWVFRGSGPNKIECQG